MSPCRVIKYAVPDPQNRYLRPEDFVVYDHSDVHDILADFHKHAGPGSGLDAQVAFLPKDVASATKSTSIWYSLSEQFVAVASRLEYPDDRDRILSLDLCDEEDDKVIQFFIRRHPDQLEFIPPGEEHDHQKILQQASSETWEPSLACKSALQINDVYPVHNWCRPHRDGPPITIYEEVFAEMVDDIACLSSRPDNEDILAKLSELAVRSLEIYDSDSQRESALYPLIESLLGVQLERRGPSSATVKTGASVEENGAIYLHVDCKNELGLGGVADLQGALTLLKRISEPKYAAIRNMTCCPCLHLFISGPYISFGGSILTGVYNYELFTDYIYLGGGPCKASDIYDTAKIFDIFRGALGKLRNRYKTLKYHHDPTIKDHQRLFPRPAYLANSDIPNLVFESRIIHGKSYCHPRCALFHAVYDGQRVVVKFSAKYNLDAHRAVAEVGLAPKLYFHAQLRGGVHMVVMESIDGSGVRKVFGYKEIPNIVTKQIEAALNVLHDKNLVHGDVCGSNILTTKAYDATSPKSTAVKDIDTPWRIYLIDFDWAGEADKDRYHLLLESSGPRNSDMRPGALLKTMHDNMMLRQI